jgi:hypothetical protein
MEEPHLPSINDVNGDGMNIPDDYLYNNQDKKNGDDFFSQMMAPDGTESGMDRDFYSKPDSNIKSLEDQITDTLNGLNTDVASMP